MFYHLYYLFAGPYNDRRLRMSCLLNLTLETTTSYKNIPKEIEDEHHSTSTSTSSRSPQLLADCLGIAASSEDMYMYSAQLILQKWLDGEGHQPASWWTLLAALERIGLMAAPYVRSAIMSTSLELTMNTLLNLPYKKTVTKTANIPREVGVKHFDFGTHLLQDPTGAHLLDLERELKNGEIINKHILTEWLEGKGRPVTWATLVEVLNIIGMGELAKQIEVRYVNDKSSVTM